MSSLHIIFLATLAMISYVSSACFQSGPSWGNADQLKTIKNQIPTLCRQLAGEYPVGGNANRCIPSIVPSLHYDISVFNLAKATKFFEYEECKTRVAKDIDTCKLGAYNSVGDWKVMCVFLFHLNNFHSSCFLGSSKGIVMLIWLFVVSWCHIFHFCY